MQIYDANFSIIPAEVESQWPLRFHGYRGILDAAPRTPLPCKDALLVGH